MGAKRCPVCRGNGWVFSRVAQQPTYSTCARCQGTGLLPDSKEPPPEVVALLVVRSGGICELCHVHQATDKHHRQYRSRGGDHSIENLLHVCGPGNAFGCHADCHGHHPREGVSVSRYERLALTEIPFRDKRGVLWKLNSDGTKQALATAAPVNPKGVWDL